MSPTDDNNNQRVTLAILGEKVDALREDLRAYCARQEKIDGRLRGVELEQERQKERLAVWTGIQTAISAALAGVAAWLGMRS